MSVQAKKVGEEGATTKGAKKKEKGGTDITQGLRYKLTHSTIFACFECLFALGEFLLVLIVVLSLANKFNAINEHTVQTIKECKHDPGEGWLHELSRVFCVVSRDIQNVLLHMVVEFLSTAVIACWMGWRCFAPLKTAWLCLPPWLGIRSPRISAIGAAVLLIDFFTFLGLVWAQQTSGRWFMSFDNYMPPFGATGEQYVKYSRVFSINFGDPLKEEIMFRGCLYYILYRRSKNPFTCLIISNAVFGAFHLINLVGGDFSPFYVLLQVLLGFEIGHFFGLRFLITGSLWEPFLLHVVNNILSGFLPARESVVLQEPAIFFTLIMTVLMYGVLNVHGIVELKRTLTESKKAKQT